MRVHMRCSMSGSAAVCCLPDCLPARTLNKACAALDQGMNQGIQSSSPQSHVPLSKLRPQKGFLLREHTGISPQPASSSCSPACQRGHAHLGCSRSCTHTFRVLTQFHAHLGCSLMQFHAHLGCSLMQFHAHLGSSRSCTHTSARAREGGTHP